MHVRSDRSTGSCLNLCTCTYIYTCMHVHTGVSSLAFWIKLQGVHVGVCGRGDMYASVRMCLCTAVCVCGLNETCDVVCCIIVVEVVGTVLSPSVVYSASLHFSLSCLGHVGEECIGSC